MKYYTVRTGREPGIYETWEECKAQVIGYSGAVFKSFDNMAAAEAYLNERQEQQPINNNLPFAYIDGTYTKAAGLYGYGGYLFNGGNTYIIQGTGNNEKYIKERNIAGEAIGFLQVVFLALKLKIEEINIYFDYAGLENWVNGSWKAKGALAEYYCDTMNIIDSDLKINFIKVKGHSDIEGNEIADYLAKEAIGAKLRKKDIAALEKFREAAAENGKLIVNF